jgi:hypothetical protein
LVVKQQSKTAWFYAVHVTGEKPMNRIGQLWRKLTGSSKQRPESSENSSGRKDASERDPQVVTYIYGGGMEEGKWL